MTAVHRLADVGVLVELADLDAVIALDATVRTRRAQGDAALTEVVDIVPAARTLLLTVDPSVGGGDLASLERLLTRLLQDDAPSGAEGNRASERTVHIPVRYDGEDLSAVATALSLSEDEVVRRHTDLTWRAAFGGFAPGFFYLVPARGDGLGRSIPRRAEPRTRVPAGAVALAGEFSAVYPRSSPGGWQLIGSTTESMWDVDRDPPALLSPGSLVRFVDGGLG